MKTSKQMDVPQKSCGKSSNNLSLAVQLHSLGRGCAEIMMSRSCRKIKSKHEGNGFQIDALHPLPLFQMFFAICIAYFNSLLGFCVIAKHLVLEQIKQFERLLSLKTLYEIKILEWRKFP